MAGEANHTVSPRRAPTLAGFLVLGLFWGAWAAVLPNVKHTTGASNGALGIGLLFASLGALPAMLFVAGPAVDRFGSRAVATAGFAFAAATALPGLAGSLPALALALLAMGATSGCLDVGVNARAAQIESATGRRLMPLCHGLYSTGVLVGAVCAGLALQLGAGTEAILVAVAAPITLAALALGADRSPVRRNAARRPHLERALLVLGLVGAAAFVIEGGMESWSALFLKHELHAGPALSGLGPGVFGGAMALGRFGAQWTRLGDRALFAGGAALAAAGCGLAAAAPSSAVALAGFAIGGFGVSVNAPIIFGTAGRGRRDAAGALAIVTTIGYLGLLVGPPIVGGVAQAASLRASFALMALAAAFIAVFASRVLSSEAGAPRTDR